MRDADALLDCYARGDDGEASLPVVAGELQDEDRDNGLERWSMLSNVARDAKLAEEFWKSI